MDVFRTKTINPWVRDHDEQPKDTSGDPVESGRPGDSVPAEAKPRDPGDFPPSTHVINPVTANTDWCPCGKCGSTADLVGSDWILCDSCSIWFHGTCVGLSSDDIANLAAPSIHWNCSSCICKTQPSSSTQNDSSQPGHLIICTSCSNMGIVKNCKGQRGLKQHYHHAHKEHLSDLSSNIQPTTCDNFPSKLSRLKQTIRVLKRIPKGARMFAAIKLEQIIKSCVDKNDFESWQELLCFTFIALRVPKRSSRKQKLTSIVKRNITDFDETSIEPTIKHGKSSSLPKRVEAKISEGDVRGAVKMLASSDQIAPQSDHTLTNLKEKHPSPSRPVLLLDPPEASDKFLIVSEREVLNGIYSFPNGSAAGTDGLCPQLKDMIAKGTGDIGTRLLMEITRLCNLMLKGGVNDEILPVLYGASLFALNKKDGGLRPIAVGNTFRRLAAKLACQSVREGIGEHFRPKQLGFATRGGCEAAIHATRTYVNQNITSNKVLLKIDLKNAFNSVERDIMLSTIKEKTPELFPFLWQCYSSPSYLFYGKDIILSEVGAQQGDPAGPLAFSLSIHPIIESLQSELNIWYLDDGTLAGDPTTVLEDFQIIIEKCHRLGLEVNPSKCELYFCSLTEQSIFEKFNEVSPGIKIISVELSLLGSPITSTASDRLLTKKLDELHTLFDRLKDLNSHTSYFLLKNCFAIPKLIYLMRSSPTWKMPEIVSLFDENTWTLSSLPIRFGGLGIRKMNDLVLPAFISSINGVFDLICNILPLNQQAELVDISNYQEAIEMWNELCPNTQIPAIPSSQKNWDVINIERIVLSLSLDSELDKARYNASCEKEANAWLSALPSRNIGLLLNNNDFRISVALRLGTPVCTPHTCSCGQRVDITGIHGLSCSMSAGRFSRHSSLNDIIKRAFASAGIPSILEPTGLSRDDGMRPDGMTLVPWTNGQTLVWDATCSDTLAPSHIRSSSNCVGSAAENAATLKRNKYSKIVEQNYLFVPFAVETLGPWCEEAKLIVEALGRRITTISGEPRAKSYLSQRISIAIQRGNAASIMGTLPQAIPMEEVFRL